MNKIIKYASLLFLLPLVLTGCNKEPKTYSPPSVQDQMNIKATAQSLVLEEANADQDAITFSWNQAQDRGAGTEIVYFFRLVGADISGVSSELVRIDEGVRSITWTVRQINDLIYDWGIFPGMEVAVRAQIVATVASSSVYMIPESSSVDFNVVGYDPNPQPNFLSMVTDVSGVETFISLEEISVGTDVFYWTGQLLTGTKIRFVRDRNEPWPAYVKGTAEGTLALEDQAAGEPNVIEIIADGTYVITANIANLKYICKSIYVLPNGYLAVVGDAVRDALWSLDNAIANCKLTQQDLKNRPEVLSYTGFFGRGMGQNQNAFKFITQNGWSGFWSATADADPTLDWSAASTDGNGDRKWVLPTNFEDGTYTLEFDLNLLLVRLVK